MQDNMTGNLGDLFQKIFNSKQKAISQLPSPTDPINKPEDSKKTLSKMKIESDPTGAQVLIDGEIKGRAPLSIELPLGKYEVIVRMAGHFNWEASVNLTGPMSEPILARLEPLVF
jgi:hypothetical protein